MPGVPLESSTPRMSQSTDGTFEVAEIEGLIRRYVTIGQYKTAMFWADKRLALCRKNNERASFVDMAEFVKVF
ncbi:unnamed protein product [Gongylonema pulchrum]|uniref:CTLH domain-containing protein n=1 Tax=Gongylonema pulchrum TaxID=637853 RepID=A0A3P6SZM6_9BILA|nr:unnamed protein product [Gongylonema pulchrum]